MVNFVLIDGQDSGGQTLRTSLSLSALTKKPFKIINIRGKREKSGLHHQHLTAVNAIAKVCNAKVKGNELHSHELEFIPSDVIPGNYKFNIGTAGSTTLILQTLLPPLLFSEEKSTIEIVGGTANPLAPPALDIKVVFLWNLKKIGIDVDLQIEREGFQPKGEGKIIAHINPCNKFNEIKICEPAHGHYEQTEVIAVSSKELKEREVAKRLIKGFKLNFPIKPNLIEKELYVDALSTSCFIHANYQYNDCKLGMSVLGKKMRTAEDIGRECAKKLLKEMKSGATTDHFTADQLLIYMAIKGSGKMKISDITDHIRTNTETIERFLDVKFSIENNVISCHKLI